MATSMLLVRSAPRRALNLQPQRRSFSSQAPPSSGNIFSGSWKIPATLGFTLIGFLQWQQLNHPTDEERKTHPAPALQRLPGTHTTFEETMATERQMQSLKLFPYRAASRLWGKVHDKELPMWLREPIYKAWTAVFNCKLDEMKYPLQDYVNLGEFFSRPLKEGARPFDTVPSHLASPVDGTVASIGVVNDSNNVPTLEQIKVNQTAARLIPSLFVENERVALLGEWEHGFFSLTAVGATNVGSIMLTKEPEFRTNTASQDKLVGQCVTKDYGGKVDTTRGEEMAQFKLGSTVVLVFEAPESFEFTVNPGDKLILGKCIGKVAK
ncbi:hypothetical protein BBJ29_003890 [Phytophthora kernoviae]|uniref:Phosphatidylserine decarboxylase n=1 Tax=Phytophthora kernoviae TaxID=325452 RepID=A0A3F2RKD3_9STRA|nr:hypothetical protein BBJ29_003890 [Phytophthora kernoviae]RLN59139.1 hypothetical protein BBP00_00006663 [Phytophthora kernoviae]